MEKRFWCCASDPVRAAGNLTRRSILVSVKSLFLAALTAFAAQTSAYADAYPSRPIRVIVPNAAGGAADVAARLAAEALARALETPVFVENRRNGLSAIEFFLSGEPDGYTILVAAAGLFTITPAAKHVSYDPVRDFIPIGTIWRSNHMLAAGRGLGVHTLGEFIAAAKARPGALSIGSTGVGTPAHLTIELLKREAGINVIHVPFRGSGESLPALVGGQIDGLVGDVQVVAPQLKSGAGLPIAVAAARRVPLLPDVPTMAEAGLANVIAESWFGFVVSAKTPPAVVKRLQDGLAATHDDPAYLQSLARQGVGTGEAGPDAFARLIKSDIDKWGPIVAAVGIKLD
jgi:tripartite-type tricarboxylate transporter receptor subunit TctC